jgi:GT2 family glycosyltransferase
MTMSTGQSQLTSSISHSGSGDRVTFSAVIPTLNRPDLLRTALEALLRCDPGPDEILVIDGTAEGVALPVIEELRAISAGRPIRHLIFVGGLTLKRNVALAECRGDVVAFFDDDARPESDVFAKLAAAYADPSVVGATGLVIEPDDRPFGRKESRLRRLLPGGGVDGTFTRYGYPRRITDVGRSCDIQFMQGCFMTARLDRARSVGFDEDLAGYGFVEDEDFSCRLARLGRLRYLADAVVHHDNTGFSTRDRRSFGRRIVIARTYLFRKNFAQTPLARAQFQLLLLIMLAHRVLNCDWLGARGLIEGAVNVWCGRPPLGELSVEATPVGRGPS